MRISAVGISCVAAMCWTAAIVSAFTTPSQRAVSIQQQAPMQRSLVSLNEKDEKKGSFFSSMFGNGESNDNGSTALRGKLPPHPSVRPHISPLNRLGPDPQSETKSEPLPVHPEVRSGTLPNGLPYVILPNKSPPGRFEAHLQVFSGSGTLILFEIVESLTSAHNFVVRKGMPICFSPISIVGGKCFGNILGTKLNLCLFLRNLS